MQDLLSWEAARVLREAWRSAGEIVVLTNGCFDLIHAGHVRYLAEARTLGDRLIVALNDDASVRRLKGPGRPVLPLADRATVLAALRSVDAVVAFSEDTAAAVIAALAPDCWVKGGDYGRSAVEPPEAAVVRAAGGWVRYLSYIEGRSTSALIARIRGEVRS